MIILHVVLNNDLSTPVVQPSYLVGGLGRYTEKLAKRQDATPFFRKKI